MMKTYNAVSMRSRVALALLMVLGASCSRPIPGNPFIGRKVAVGETIKIQLFVKGPTVEITDQNDVQTVFNLLATGIPTEKGYSTAPTFEDMVITEGRTRTEPVKTTGVVFDASWPDKMYRADPDSVAPRYVVSDSLTFELAGGRWFCKASPFQGVIEKYLPGK